MTSPSSYAIAPQSRAQNLLVSLALGPFRWFSAKTRARDSRAGTIFHDARSPEATPMTGKAIVTAAVQTVENKRIPLNSTLPQVHDAFQNDALNSWSTCNPNVFNVRQPLYSKNGLKAPSVTPALYNTISVDVYSTDTKMRNLSRFLDLASLETERDGLPGLFIVNFMIPTGEPSIYSPFASDGATVSYNIVMQLSDWTKENPNDPGVILYRSFLNDCRTGFEERIKLIALIANVPALNLNFLQRELYVSCSLRKERPL